MALGKQNKSPHKGQRKKVCDINGCEKNGRILANLGGIPIAYCPEHRKKYGERIINALINASFNYRLSNFLLEIKSKIFMSDDFLCTTCGEKLKQYIISKTEELEDIIKYAEENEAGVNEEDLK